MRVRVRAGAHALLHPCAHTDAHAFLSFCPESAFCSMLYQSRNNMYYLKKNLFFWKRLLRVPLLVYQIEAGNFQSVCSINARNLFQKQKSFYGDLHK